MARAALLGAAALLLCVAPARADGQNYGDGDYHGHNGDDDNDHGHDENGGDYAVTISPLAPDLGNVVSAASGETVFTVAPDTGMVRRKSGAGRRLTTRSARALVTISCGDREPCNHHLVRVRIGSFGTPTKRIGAMANFTVAPSTAQIVRGPTGSNPIDFAIAPVGRRSSATFFVGADIPIAGNDSGRGTGRATSGFYVYVAADPHTPSHGAVGLAGANVFRPLSVGKHSDLKFGSLVRPRAGVSHVTVDAVTGARQVVGGAAFPQPAPGRALFKVQGEGGRSFSIQVPETVTLTNAAGQTLTASLSSSAAGVQTLHSSLGRGGAFWFGVGGELTLAPSAPVGAYAGSLVVSVDYN